MYELGYNLSDFLLEFLIGYKGFNFYIPEFMKLRFFPISPNAAEKYETCKKRKDKNGYADTLLYFNIFLKLKRERVNFDKNKSSVLNYEEMYRRTLLGSDIIAFDVFDHDSFVYNYLGTVK